MTKNTLKRTVAGIFVAGALSASSLVAAQDAGTEESGFGTMFEGWRGTATLGATSSSGNSEASNINGAIRLSKTVNRWEHLLFGSVFKGTSSIVINQTDAQGEAVLGDDGLPQRIVVKGDNSDRIALGYQPKFYYTPKTYFFALLDWETDEPSNIDSATRQVIGVGHRFFSDESGFLTAEVGFGNKNTALVVGDDIDGGVGYLGVNYLNHITEEVSFNADLRSDFGSDNTFVELGLGISFKVSDKLAFKVAHFSRSNSDLSDGADPLIGDSESVTSMNLVFDI